MLENQYALEIRFGRSVQYDEGRRRINDIIEEFKKEYADDNFEYKEILSSFSESDLIYHFNKELIRDIFIKKVNNQEGLFAKKKKKKKNSLSTPVI